jgi:hypothetical protein
LDVFRGLVGDCRGVGVFVPTAALGRGVSLGVMDCGVSLGVSVREGIGVGCWRVGARVGVLVGVAVFAARLAGGISAPVTVLITRVNKATLPMRTTAHTFSRVSPFCNEIHRPTAGSMGAAGTGQVAVKLGHSAPN